MSRTEQDEREWQTRKKRIDPRLQALGWQVVPYDEGTPLASLHNCAVTEFPTSNGPADYGLVADAIEKNVAAATTRAEKLTQSILTKAFRGELVPTEAELAAHEARAYEPSKVVPFPIAGMVPYPVAANITRAGPRVRAGVCCLVHRVRPHLMICDKMYRIRVDQRVAVPRFVELALNEPAMIERIDTMKTGISDSGVNLTQKGFLGIPLSLPSIEEQREIVRRVDALFQLADAVEKRYATGRAAVENLTQSILARAFRGELVPQDPEDEPASVLLERIRGEEAVCSEPRKGR